MFMQVSTHIHKQTSSGIKIASRVLYTYASLPRECDNRTNTKGNVTILFFSKFLLTCRDY